MSTGITFTNNEGGQKQKHFNILVFKTTQSPLIIKAVNKTNAASSFSVQCWPIHHMASEELIQCDPFYQYWGFMAHKKRRAEQDF